MPEARPTVVQPKQAVLTPVAKARNAYFAVLLGPELGVPNFITRRFVLEPGGRIPCHRHPTIEHEQVVVKGEMILSLDGIEHKVRTGDAVFIPAGCAHWYENRGSEPVEFLCVVPSTRDYATEWLEEPPSGAYLGS